MGLLPPETSLLLFAGQGLDVEVLSVDRYGRPVDLTGFTVTMTVRVSLESSLDALIVKSSDVPGEIDVTPLLGKSVVHLEPGDTELDAGQYVYDVWATADAPLRRIPLIATSDFVVEQAVTTF